MLLNDVLNTISQTYNFSSTKEVIFLNTGDILEGKLLHSNYSDTAFLPGQAKKSIANGDILFSEIRPANKRYVQVDVVDPTNYVVSTKLMVLRVINKDFNSRYVYHFLTQENTLCILQSLAESRSGTFPQITFSEIQSLDIPTYTLEDQQHIVDTMC